MLREKDISPDIVYAASISGFPVAKKVADGYNIPLDIVLADTISAPGKPGIPVGAVAYDGTLWLKDSAVEELEITSEYIENAKKVQLEGLEHKIREFRKAVDRPHLRGRHVVLVTDGIATGLRTTSCIGLLIKAGAERITVATPVISDLGFEVVEEFADIVAVEKPRFMASKEKCYGEAAEVDVADIRRSITPVGPSP